MVAAASLTHGKMKGRGDGLDKKKIATWAQRAAGGRGKVARAFGSLESLRLP